MFESSAVCHPLLKHSKLVNLFSNILPNPAQELSDLLIEYSKTIHFKSKA